jgi:hypothetical protein
MMTMLHSVWSGGGSAAGRRRSLLALGALLALVASVLFWASPSDAQNESPPVAIASVEVTASATPTQAAVATLKSNSFDPDDGDSGCENCTYKWEVVTESYSWLTISDAKRSTATFNVPPPATAARFGQSIEFRLTVTDDGSPPATDSTTVTFNINQGPTADIAVTAMMADPANPDVKNYDDNGNGVKDENAEKYPLDGVIDGPGENGNADNEWDIAEGSLIILDGSGSSDPNGVLPAASHDWTRVYTSEPDAYDGDPAASLPAGSPDTKKISTDENLEADVADRSTEVMTPLVSAAGMGYPAPSFFVYYKLTVTDTNTRNPAKNSAVVKIVVHDQPQDPVIDSIVPSANTDAAAGGVPGSAISGETGAPGSNRYIIAPRSAITLTITDNPADGNDFAYSDPDGYMPTVTWEGARSTNPDPSEIDAPDLINTKAAFTAPASAEEGDEFTVTATATDVTGRTTSKSVTLVVATNTAPEAVAPGTPAPTRLFSSIVVNDGPDGGDIDPLTGWGTGTVKLRGISHDADGDSLIHNWTELDMVRAGNPPADTLPAFNNGNPADGPNRATFPRGIKPPAKAVVSIDGAFGQDASFKVPEVNAMHTKMNITEAQIGVDLDGDGATNGTAPVSVVPVPIAFTVLDKWQVKTTKFVIVFIQDNDDIPRANAGPNQQVTPGSFVRLNGAGSSDSDPGDKLSYLWTYMGIETDPLTQNRPAITARERGLGYVEGKWFPYDGKAADGTDVSDEDEVLDGAQGHGDYHPTAGGALKNNDTAFPYFDAPRLGGFSSIKLKFSLVVTDGAATEDGADDNESRNPAVVTITITDGFYSGNVTGPDFCLVQSLGGPTTYPFDSNFDGVADTCSLNTTRRATVARQNALETLAVLNPDTFKDHLHGRAAVEDDPNTNDVDEAVTAVTGQCAGAPRNLGDSAGDLANDSCGRVGSFNRVVSAPPRPVDPAKADEFFSGVITGPNFCANNSLGGATTYAFDSDGDGVADICSLPFTRREAVARQNALVAAFSMHDQYDEALKAACAALGSTSFGDSAGALATDHCSRPPTGPTGNPLPRSS